LQRQRVDPYPVSPRDRIGGHVKSIGAALECVEGGGNLLGSLECESDRFETGRARHFLDRLHLQQRAGTAGVGHYRQAAQARDKLAQQFESFGGQIHALDRQPGDVAAGPRQARNNAGADLIGRQREHDGDRRGSLLRSIGPDSVGEK